MSAELKNRLRNCASITESRKSCLVCPDRRLCKGLPELLREAANEIEAREPMDDSERIRLNNKLNALLEKIRDIRILLETYGGMNEN